MTLLVADDNEEVLKLVRTLLELDGHCFLPASNGSEALGPSRV
jgi:CheY-like chemotaxis protein